MGQNQCRSIRKVKLFPRFHCSVLTRTYTHGDFTYKGGSIDLDEIHVLTDETRGKPYIDCCFLQKEQSHFNSDLLRGDVVSV